MFTYSVLVVSLLATTIAGFENAEGALALEVLGTRAPTSGGWGLINPTCSEGTQQCDRFCCPTTLECEWDPAAGHHCCPTGSYHFEAFCLSLSDVTYSGSNCLAAYQASPQCADDSWSLWRVAKSATGAGYFCCLPDQIGTNAGTCVTGNTPVVATLSASLVCISPFISTKLTEAQVASATGVAAPQSTSASAKVSSPAATKTKSSDGAQATTSSSETAQKTSGGNINMARVVGIVPLGVFAGGIVALL